MWFGSEGICDLRNLFHADKKSSPASPPSSPGKVCRTSPRCQARSAATPSPQARASKWRSCGSSRPRQRPTRTRSASSWPTSEIPDNSVEYAWIWLNRTKREYVWIRYNASEYAVIVRCLHTHGIQYNMLESDPLIYDRISAEREYKENAAAMCGGGGVGLKFVTIWRP